MNYPDNWFCKLCYKQFKDHVKIGTPGEESFFDESFLARMNYCISLKGVESHDTPHPNYFTPIDNLTQIELLAKDIKD